MKKNNSNGQQRNVTTLICSLILTLPFLFTQCDMANEQEISTEASPNTESASYSPSTSTTCADCDHVVNNYVTDGTQLNIQPGDIICLDASVDYNRLVFRNIVGTRNNPVIIRNCGGIAKIYSDASFGLKFENSKDFKLIGDGTDDQYGIRVTTEKGFYVTMERFTTDVEMARIEVAGSTPEGKGDRAGFAGIGVKTSPYQDCELFTDHTRQAWVMRDISIHDNYIHDTGGEGIYMGHGFYTGRKESKCPAITYSHSIRGVKIYNNLIENVGYDGIQIKNANQNVRVYNNVIRNYGTKNHSAHNEGLFIGEGTTGKFYNNLVDTGTGNGCQIQGIGNLDIYNNIFYNSGEHGIYASHGKYVKRLKEGYFNIMNNSVINSQKYGFVFYNNDGGPKRFVNNLVANAGTLTKNGAELEASNNVFTNDVPNLSIYGLVKSVEDILGLGSVVDAGADLSSFGILDDIYGRGRPDGGAFDIGAQEGY
ncbi:right-handed parallel beta-helix repeat-containing protein [Marinoscillum furvescens]|uniref:Parallel beta helix pectate lyase-like protein n=1 Tax=Marinoscillum furvescens DSM 4134 TaxID=1122208 RepID=A0A3D9KZD4_MARFU|nr:right-handed parallel beta-helix repeat-containing protein [Marinoscillum furvescens]RED95650.1 parallel beta helix pectate lyase-like protein [Marinoscillum furvescens DSM 4134]